MLTGILGGIELLLFGGALVPLGELLRVLGAKLVPVFRTDGVWERALLDFYFGCGAVYLLALSPIPGFSLASATALAVAGAVGLAVFRWASGKGGSSRVPSRGTVSVAALLPSMIVALSALGLLLGESFLAAQAAAGNTYDSSVLDLYTALLLSHGHLTFDLAPVATQGVIAPQGSTALYAFGQLLLAPAPALTPLELTPWFIALSPVGAWVLARRWGAGPWGAATTALGFALLGSGTRVLVSGSYDFVAAFPLVLLLLGWSEGSRRWAETGAGQWANAVGFGVVAGISAAISPLGAQLVFLGLPVWLVTQRPLAARAAIRWIGHWASAVGVALLFVAPSLLVLWAGRSSSGFVPGAGPLYPAAPSGLGLPTVIAALDPFLLGPADVRLSPFPLLRIELIVLLVGALFWLYVLRRSAAQSVPFGLYQIGLLASLAGSIAVLAALWSGTTFAPLLDWTSFVTSPDQLGVLLFAVYTVVALAPVGELVSRAFPDHAHPSGGPVAASTTEPPPRPPRRRPGFGVLSDRWASGAVALLLLVPGIAVTWTELPRDLSDEYHTFGQVSQADFQAIDWMSAHLPAGARLLVAPGSAAEFVVAQDPHVVLLFPMTPISANGTYEDLVSHLIRGDLGGNASADLRALGVEYIAVTGQNNRLFPPFSAAPLLRSPAFSVLFQSGDATVFSVVR